MKNANTPKNSNGSPTIANDTPLQPIKKPFDPSRDIVPPEVMEIARNDAEKLHIILRTGRRIHRFNQSDFGLINKSIHSMVSGCEKQYGIPVERCPAGIKHAPTTKQYFYSDEVLLACQMMDEGKPQLLEQIKRKHRRKAKKRAVATMTKKTASFISEIERDPEVWELCPDLLEFLLEVGDHLFEIIKNRPQA